MMLSREQLLKLDIHKIRSNGRYVDFETPSLFMLSSEDIDFLRHYYKNYDIASDVTIVKEKQVPKNYKLSRNNKYSKYQMGGRIPRKSFVPVIMFGTVVLVSTVFIASKLNVKATPGIYESNGIIYEDPSVEDIREELSEIGGLVETPIRVSEPSTSVSQVLVLDSIDEISNRIDNLMYFCNVYQVDFQMVYDHLKEITNDFTDVDYLENHHIEGVTCKGEEVYASSEEELLLFYVRCCKQIPDRMGLSNISIQKDYESSRDYYEDIYYCSNLIGVDPCLVYGIIMSESSFTSDMFLSMNNPAGIRNGSGFWRFDTPEEGIFETCMEVRKYMNKGMKTIEQISTSYAPIGAGDDPHNLNAGWVSNVTQNYEYAKEHMDVVFGIKGSLRKE